MCGKDKKNKLATCFPQCWSEIKRIENKNRCLGEHQEVAERQICHQDVPWSPQCAAPETHK